jgi:hypothetical protein
MPKYSKPLSHGDKLVDPNNTECLHPLCGACAQEAFYRQLSRIGDALERIARATEVATGTGS